MTLRIVWITLLVVAVTSCTAILTLVLPTGGQADVEEGSTFTTRKGRLIISVSEAGTIKNREQVEIKSEVEGRTTVLRLAKEGSHVQPGDLLVELDTSKLIDQKTGQEITVIQSEAALIRARENSKVIKNQSDSDISIAELDHRFASEDLRKYKEGEYPQLLLAANSKITLAKVELERATEKLKWSKILFAEEYISENELQGDELSHKRAELDLELARGELDLLTNFTYKRRVDELESNVDQTERSLERINLRTAADIVQAIADLKAKEQEFERQETMLAKINYQLSKCKILAPVPGMVVYATTGRGRYRGNEEPLEEGTEVHERQELMFLPTANDMMVEVKIHESALDKVREGMPVRVTVDAVPGVEFPGTVARIGLLPDAQSSWLNPDLKVYSTEIHLNNATMDLRAGMSCRAEIIVDDYDDAIYVPIQTVLRVNGQPTVYLQGEKGPEPLSVEIGLDNNRMVHVTDGLDVGTEVLLSPPLEPSTMEDSGGDAPPRIEATTGMSTTKKELSPTDSKKRGSEDGRKGERGRGKGGERNGREGRGGERGRSAEGKKNGGSAPDLSKMPEEARRRFEKMSDEEKKAMMDKMKNFGGQQKSGGRGPGGGQ